MSTSAATRCTLRETADLIAERARASGWSLRREYASRTGSIYLELRTAGERLQVRIADHTPAKPAPAWVRRLECLPEVGGSVGTVMGYLARRGRRGQ